MATYNYSRGNLLKSPNNYFFSDVGGSTFLNAYLVSRIQSLRFFSESAVFIGTLIPHSMPSPWPLTEWDEWISDVTRHEVPTSIELFLKRFAVSKKVWSRYTDEVRPTDDASHGDLRLYIEVGKLAIDSVSKCQDLRFLNVALQCTDIVIAHGKELSTEYFGLAVDLVVLELACVMRVWRGELP